MSIDEYIERNLPFYHITPKSNLENILKNGLEKRKLGICVVRSKDEAVLNEVIRQIDTYNSQVFSVIEIRPKEKGITADIVSEDGITAVTAKLHNYIVTERIPIEEKDIVYSDYKPNHSVYTIPEEIIVGLTGYHIPKRPFIDEATEAILEEFS